MTNRDVPNKMQKTVEKKRKTDPEDSDGQIKKDDRKGWKIQDKIGNVKFLFINITDLALLFQEEEVI